MNTTQSHASLLLLAVMGVPWLIDRLFTWMERRAEMRRALERRLCAAEMATWDVKYSNSCSSYTIPSFAGCLFHSNTITSGPLQRDAANYQSQWASQSIPARGILWPYY